jgi:acyl-CoA thioester hydrolase
MKIRVYYEDTDTGGIVYHSNYLNFCERARSEVFFAKGITPELESGHFVARKIEANYFKPAKLGDLLDVKTELLEMKNASFSLKQSVYKKDQKLFDLVIKLAYIDFDGRPQKLSGVKEFILDLFRG